MSEIPLRRMQCKHIASGEIGRVASIVYKTDHPGPLANAHQNHIEVAMCSLCSGLFIGFMVGVPINADEVP